MNRSKPGLNEPFYKWLDDIRRAMRKEKELQKKFKFYNVKLNSCRRASFDRIRFGSVTSEEDELLFWIDKITITESFFFAYRGQIQYAQKFMAIISSQQQIVFSKIVGTKISLYCFF